MEEDINKSIIKDYESHKNLKKYLNLCDKADRYMAKKYNLDEKTEQFRKIYVKLSILTNLLRSKKLQNSEEDINTFCDELIKIADELRSGE